MELEPKAREILKLGELRTGELKIKEEYFNQDFMVAE